MPAVIDLAVSMTGFWRLEGWTVSRVGSWPRWSSDSGGEFCSSSTLGVGSFPVTV